MVVHSLSSLGNEMKDVLKFRTGIKLGKIIKEKGDNKKIVFVFLVRWYKIPNIC